MKKERTDRDPKELISGSWKLGPRRFIKAIFCFPVLMLVIFAGTAALSASGQSNQPITASGSIPFETVAAWFNPEHTEVEDEVLLRGSIYFTARTWKTGTYVDRITFHGNAVDIHGTSDATGQRFRLTGSFSFDLRDPAVTYNPDGTFTLPPQDFRLHFFKVDPEPARLDGYLGTVNSSAAATYFGAPGTLFIGTEPYITNFYVSGGPDGSTIFSGSPLIMRLRVWPDEPHGTSVQWHCRTGDQEALVTPLYVTSLGQYFRCTPLYSATEPVKVYAVVTTIAGWTKTSEVRTYHMVERPEITSYDDEATFLAETGAENATGSLPDLGAIDGAATIGSVTFSLAPGGNSLFIGGLNSVPDWYPQTPGNEIAMGYESLQVSTATPVYALGFEFIEPNTTMPLWGGTPVDSTYSVTLYSGTTPVGIFTFNAPDDVAPTFVGVWSDTAFDRAVITDITGSPNSDDDEYFGEFFTGTTPLP